MIYLKRLAVTACSVVLFIITVSRLPVLLTTVTAEPITSPPVTSPPITSPEVTFTPTPTATPTPASRQEQNNNNQSSNNNNSSGETNKSTSCEAAKPEGKPVLFQINTTKNSASLFITPVVNANGYVVIYSKKLGEDQYGTVFNESVNGVVKLTINNLERNTRYYFKVSAKNGCASGDWSDWLGAKTTLGATAKFYPYNQKALNNVLGTSAKKVVKKKAVVKKTNTTKTNKKSTVNKKNNKVQKTPKNSKKK